MSTRRVIDESYQIMPQMSTRHANLTCKFNFWRHVHLSRHINWRHVYEDTYICEATNINKTWKCGSNLHVNSRRSSLYTSQSQDILIQDMYTCDTTNINTACTNRHGNDHIRVSTPKKGPGEKTRWTRMISESCKPPVTRWQDHYSSIHTGKDIQRTGCGRRAPWPCWNALRL